MIDTKGIKNIILDLGGVILELDVERTISTFHELGFPRLNNADIILSKYPFFQDFETGMLSAEEFVRNVINIAGRQVSEKQVLDAWNAMIRGFKPEIISLLLDLRKKYRLFLLSNTNAIHEVHYNLQLKNDHGIENLDRIFEKVYYSHVLKLRKPNAEIFQYVLKDAGIPGEECIYIDDTLEHIETARLLGIQAYHLEAPERITDIL